MDMLWLLVIVALVMPFAWLVAEFQSRVWLRIVLGIAGMAGVFCLANLLMIGRQFETNSYFSFTSQELIESTIEGLRKGESAIVLSELEVLHDEYAPTYENRAEYQELVNAYSKRLKDQRSNELD
jgi:hypothetical protein